MLSRGDKLGRYEVVAPLGAGGMGEVYRALDAELQREVAVKILPEELSSDPDRVRRFEREAKAVAALAHPNVLTVFDVGRREGQAYIVFERLEGSTLAEVMKPAPLRVREALEYGAQIARGLAAVHARGIVHRDLKPANLFLTTAGVVKIIDFGLARTAAPPPQSREETTAEVTGPGMALGTVSYMSPEQSQGLALDTRSDIFSFGTVLYEMLSGRHPWKRDSAAGTVASILRDDPPELGPLASGVPGAIAQLVGRCLQKRPEDRFQSANDLALALDLLKRGESWSSTGAPGAERGLAAAGAASVAAPAPAKRRSVVLGVAAVVAMAALAVAWLMRRPSLPPGRVEPLTTMTGFETNPTFSPDGEQVAFQWGGDKSDNTDIYVKLLGSPELRRLTTHPLQDWRPTWSPDGRQVAFVRFQPPAGGRIHVVSPLGGVDRQLSDAPAGLGFSWTADGRWLATGASAAVALFGSPTADRGIRLVRVADGEVRVATTPVAPTFHLWPAFSPDGRRLAYQSCVINEVTCSLELLELGADVTPTGPARRLTARPFYSPGGGSLAWAPDGTSLLFIAGALGRVYRVGAAGVAEPEIVELAGHRVRGLAVAAKRNRLAFERGLSRHSIARFVPGRPAETVLSSTFGDSVPDYSPDGQRIAFASTRNGESAEIWLAGADGSSPLQLTHGPGQWQGSPRFSPDGRTIAFDSQGADGSWDIWTIDSSRGPPRRFTSDPANDNLPSWSRDGRFIYWNSTRTNPGAVWRAPAAGGAEERVTASPGTARESVDGKALFFSSPGVQQSELRTMTLADRVERTAVDCVRGRGFVPVAGGLYYVGCGGPQAREVPLHLLDPASGRDRLLGLLENHDMGLAVSPDGRSILYTRVQGEGSDLMLIENFR